LVASVATTSTHSSSVIPGGRIFNEPLRYEKRDRLARTPAINDFFLEGGTPMVPRGGNVPVLVHVPVPETTTDYSCTGTGTAPLFTCTIF
jgi:hypothetical protein